MAVNLLVIALGVTVYSATSQEIIPGVYILERDLAFAKSTAPTTSQPTTSTAANSNFAYGYYSYISPVLGLHVAFMLLAFTLLLPIGACVAMLGDRRKGGWYGPHIALQHLGILSATAGFVLGFVYRAVRYGGGHFTAAHHIVGFVAYCLLLIQLVLGWCRPHLNLDRSMNASRRFWLWLHRFTALSIFCLAFANIFMGPQTFWKTVSHPNRHDGRGVALMTVSYVFASFAFLGLLSVLLYRLCCAPTSRYRHRREGGRSTTASTSTTAARKRERQDTSPRTSVTKEDANGAGPQNSRDEV